MKKLFILIAAATLMAACAEDITTNQTDGDKRYISFSVSNEQNTSTRSVVAPWAADQAEMADVEKKTVEVETDFPTEYPLSLTITDEPFIHHANSDITRGALLNSGDAASLQFGVTEFLTSNPTTPIFSNSKPAYQRTLDDGRELFKANEFWEYDSYDGISYDFYAYAPKVDGTAQGITLHTSEGTDEEKAHCYRRITYNAAGVNVGNQPDLMTAMKWSSSYVGAIPLNFQHRLCAIQIITAGTWATGFHVSGVQFTNVISSGTFDIDTDKDVAWASYGSVGNYTVTGFNEASATGTTITGTVTPSTDERWLMLPPQTLDGAKLSITMSDGTNEYTISAPIHASTWRAGHTVTYTVSPEAVSDLIVNYPTGSARSWNDGSNPQTGPVTTYTDADRFGLFVLDKDNNIFISNQCVSPIAGSDAASRTLNIPSLFKSKQFRYFLMYPYIDNASLEALVGTDNYNNYYKLDGTGRPASADAFFAEVIANWAPVNDQSTEAAFKAQDLQIAKLSGDHFDMVHKMGLIAITMPSHTVRKTRYYQISGSEWVENATKNDNTANSVTAYGATTFTSSYKPWASTTTTCFLISKPGSGAPTITANRGTSDSHYSWSVDDQSITSAASYKAKTISSFPTYFYKAWEFSYEGAGREFTIPETGTYCIECWGASAGLCPPNLTQTNPQTPGYGGYTSGNINLDANALLYVFVGQQGRNDNYSANLGGWNGGGGAGYYPNYTGSGGGGSTDVRLTVKDTDDLSIWQNDNSLRSRIIVAAGGGGCSGYYSGGYGGGLIGGPGKSDASHYSINTGGTQTTGGIATTASSHVGYFGYAYQSYVNPNNMNSNGGGGGGGYWGGTKGYGTGGGGGSSYISGHAGCIAVTSESSTDPKGGADETTNLTIDRASHYSGKVFIESTTVMIDGEGRQWNTTRGSTVVNVPQTDYFNTTNRETSTHGRYGNGFARITQITD